MAYSDVISRGRGRLELFVQIEGVKYVLSTTSTAPTDAWYTGGSYTLLPGLRAETIRREVAARPGEVWPDMSGFDLEVDDPDDSLSTHLVGLDGAISAELTATLTTIATAVDLASTAAFPSSGECHIEREACSYSGKSATQLTGLTRGIHGSVAVEHLFSDSLWPPCVPLVSATPDGLRGRRVVIYVAELAPTGTLSATSQLWVGVVDGSESWSGRRCRIPVRHALAAFVDAQVAGYLPHARIRGLYVPNDDGSRWGRFRVYDPNNGTQELDLVTDGTATYYDSSSELVQAFVAAISGLTDWDAGQLPDGRVYVVYSGAAPAGSYSMPYVDTLDAELAIILGFAPDAGYQVMAASINARIIAVDLPASVFAPIFHGGNAMESRVYVGTGEAQLFFESLVSIETAGTSFMLQVLSVNTSDDYLVVDLDHSFYTTEIPSVIMVLGPGLPPLVRQVLALKGYKIHDVVRTLWSGTMYSGSSLPYTLPKRLLPEPSLRDGDVDWDSLEGICTAAPAAASTMYLAITEETGVADLLTGALFACGAYAIILEDGSVAWRRVAVPTAVGASVTVDGAMIDGRRCVEVDTERSRDRVINCITFKVSGPFLEMGETFPPIIIPCADQASLSRYGARPARLSDVTEEVELSVAQALWDSGATIAQELARHVAGALRFLGRELARVRLPVTPRARSLEIGDVVYLTTRWVRNTSTGGRGVTLKVCQVMGWTRPEGYAQAVDELDLAIIDSPAGAISPAALATTWDSGSKKLTFADVDLYHLADDASDLTWFESGDQVELVEYDDESPSLWYGEVDEVDVAGSVTLTTAPVGLTAPCIIRFADREGSSTDQMGEGWIWIADSDDGLIQDDSAGRRWG